MVGSEVFVVVTTKSVAFCVVTPYSSESAHHFGGTYRLHFSGSKNKQSKLQAQLSFSKLHSATTHRNELLLRNLMLVLVADINRQ
jgi:hypothetical protein